MTSMRALAFFATISALLLYDMTLASVCTGNCSGTPNACPSNYVYNSCYDSCYYMSTSVADYMASLSDCISNGAHLFVPNSPSEFADIMASASTTGNAKYWIGLQDWARRGAGASNGTWAYGTTVKSDPDGVWKWMDYRAAAIGPNYTANGTNFIDGTTPWLVFQTMPSSGEFVIYLQYVTSSWLAVSSGNFNTKNRYICEYSMACMTCSGNFTKYLDSCYYLSKTNNTYSSTISSCAAKSTGATLWCPKTEAQLIYARLTANALGTSIWTGLDKLSGSWQWQDTAAAVSTSDAFDIFTGEPTSGTAFRVVPDSGAVFTAVYDGWAGWRSENASTAWNGQACKTTAVAWYATTTSATSTVSTTTSASTTTTTAVTTSTTTTVATTSTTTTQWTTTLSTTTTQGTTTLSKTTTAPETTTTTSVTPSTRTSTTPSSSVSTTITTQPETTTLSTAKSETTSLTVSVTQSMTTTTTSETSTRVALTIPTAVTTETTALFSTITATSSTSIAAITSSSSTLVTVTTTSMSTTVSISTQPEAITTETTATTTTTITSTTSEPTTKMSSISTASTTQPVSTATISISSSQTPGTSSPNTVTSTPATSAITSTTSSVSGSCGNGILEISLGETCDDSNVNNGDGCSTNCTLEYVNRTLDIYFVVDTSFSVPFIQLSKVKTFLKIITSQLYLTSNGGLVQLGVIAFGGRTAGYKLLSIGKCSQYSQSQIKSSLNGMYYFGNVGNLSNAMDRILDSSTFSSSDGRRSNATAVAVLVTSSSAPDMQNFEDQLSQLLPTGNRRRLHVLAIGNKIKKKQLARVEAWGESYERVKTYDQLASNAYRTIQYLMNVSAV